MLASGPPKEGKTSDSSETASQNVDEVQVKSTVSSTSKEEEPPAKQKRQYKLESALVVFILATIGLLIAVILLAVNQNPVSSNDNADVAVVMESNVPDNVAPNVATVFSEGENACDGKKLVFKNKDCVHPIGPQAGANVTKGFVGGMDVDVVPNTKQYWQSSMCPVNVHWHLGTEHYSVGQYDEFGNGPNGNAAAPGRKLAEKDVRGGFRCHHYDEKDPIFTTKYEWKHCKNMVVGETYEVHWPHSAAGACGKVDQYQTPFYDGVFCNLDMAGFTGLQPQDIASAVGVQGQVFTVVNDEKYFYPDMMRGWIVDGDYGKDIHYYTGSTTGTSRNNDLCSQYSPITWQVDRKCHLISASSFDKLCYDMKQQRDDMTEDLHAHGSRILVDKKLVANNQQRRRLHEHIYGHDHEHEEWF